MRSCVASWDHVNIEKYLDDLRSSFLFQDRYMSPDIQAATKLLKEGKIWNAVKTHIEAYHSSQSIETRVFSPSTFTAGEDRPHVSQPRKRKTSLTNGPSKHSK